MVSAGHADVDVLGERLVEVRIPGRQVPSLSRGIHDAEEERIVGRVEVAVRAVVRGVFDVESAVGEEPLAGRPRGPNLHSRFVRRQAGVQRLVQVAAHVRGDAVERIGRVDELHADIGVELLRPLLFHADHEGVRVGVGLVEVDGDRQGDGVVGIGAADLGVVIAAGDRQPAPGRPLLVEERPPPRGKTEGHSRRG